MTGRGSDGDRCVEQGSGGRSRAIDTATKLGKESPDMWGRAERAVAGGWGCIGAGHGRMARGSGGVGLSR
jgi:hypothetical protein